MLYAKESKTGIGDPYMRYVNVDVKRGGIKDVYI